MEEHPDLLDRLHSKFKSDSTEHVLLMYQTALETIGKEYLKLSVEWYSPVHERMSYSYLKRHGGLLPPIVDSLPDIEAFDTSRLGKIISRGMHFLRAQMPLVAKLTNPQISMNGNHHQNIDILKQFFHEDYFPIPRAIADHDHDYWTQDSTFADQFLNGCNPIVIERVVNMNYVNSQMPIELRSLTDPSGRNVETLVEEGHLFCADYEILARVGAAHDEESGAFVTTFQYASSEETENPIKKYFYAPFVAFYQTCKGRLGVLGITLTRFSENGEQENIVYNMDTCRDYPNLYVFAKMHVACADNNFHQFYSHLGRCHLIFEPFGVAVRNIFQYSEDGERTDHIVGKLLAPHFKDHIAINWFARKTLIADEGAIPFTDATFALGAKQGLSLFAMKYREWNFKNESFPDRLKKRGFDSKCNDGLAYHYREDGVALWKALECYVQKVLNVYYSNKAGSDSPHDVDWEVQNDTTLQAWCDEMRGLDRANISSFPSNFECLADLVKTITTIIYYVSAEHTAVNASQERYLAYVPNRPNALFQPVPRNPSTDMDMNTIIGVPGMMGNEDGLGAMMPFALSFFQVQFAQLLTLPTDRPLTKLQPIGTDYEESHKVLMEDLNNLHLQITLRNEETERQNDCGENVPPIATYEYLDPTTVAQSIEI